MINGTEIERLDDLGTLWQDWRDALAAQGRADPAHVLCKVLAARGLGVPAVGEVRLALAAGGKSARESAARFADCMVPVIAGRRLRLEMAFTHLADGAGHLPLDGLRSALRHAFVDAEARDAMLAELDADGDLEVTLADFMAFHPDLTEARPGATPVAPAAPVMPAGEAAQSVARSFAGSGAHGTISPLALQTGFFRLVQGAAYRTFRESWSANSETHQRARDLPYTVADFVAFVRAATDYYLSLGIVTGTRARAEFAKLAMLIEDEYRALLDRIETWDRLDKTPAMLAAEAILDREAQESTDHRRLFALAVDYLLALRQHGIAPDAATPDSLDRHETNRLRAREMQVEHGHGHQPDGIAGAAVPYHDSYSPVILTADVARRPGTIMPVAFWYDRFMPQLLLCASIRTDDDLDRETALDAEGLDLWHREFAAAGAFDRYGTDLRDGFAACTLPVKRSLRQAWRLTEHYLNGLQKRRERAEFGRDSGYLSQYVAFIDLHLGRSDVADAEMRLSFPYYIGPAVWGFLHCAANLVEAMDAPARAEGIARFKRFFRAFATMYPCPYCRYHLNRYVVRNREVMFYPVEFLLLGQKPDKDWFDISLDDRLDTIAAERPGSLRLFLWKLHNAVSSSIQRTEEWYHHEDHPIYTTRFWPSFDAEIPRLRNQGVSHVDLDHVAAIHGVTRPAANLSILRDEVHRAVREGDRDEIARIVAEAEGVIAHIERAVVETRLLETSYAYDPERIDTPPHLTEAEEAYARSGVFVER